LTNYLKATQNPAGPEEIANPDEKQVNLEHVLPQNYGKVWTADFSSGVDLAEYVYRIGNLTLLVNKANKDAGSTSFANKLKVALKPSTLAINQYFHTAKKWGEKEIDDRQNELAKAATEVWAL